MKKILAMVLAVVMVLSLAACGASTADNEKLDDILATLDSIQATLDSLTAEEAPADEAEAPAEEEAPAAEGIDFTWNGQMEVWSILPTTAAEGLVMINDFMGAVMEEAGFTYVKKDAEGNPGNQVNFVEQAISAGNVGCLMIAAMSVEMLQDIVEEAMDKGIAVVYLGAQPTDYDVCGCIYTAYEITGMWAVKAAEDWVAQRVAEGGNIPTNADGLYEVAVDDYYDIADGVYRSNAIVGTIEKSETLTMVSETVAYGTDAPLTTAYNNAQAALNGNPDCHIFIAYEPDEAMGINNAIVDYCEQNDYDLADYCVIPCYGEDSTFGELYAEVLEDNSANAIKGYATYGDVIRNGEELGGLQCTGEHLADALLFACGIDVNDSLSTWSTISTGGGVVGGTYYDTITVTNVYGYSDTWVNGDDNPAAEYKQ